MNQDIVVYSSPQEREFQQKMHEATKTPGGAALYLLLALALLAICGLLGSKGRSKRSKGVAKGRVPNRVPWKPSPKKKVE